MTTVTEWLRSAREKVSALDADLILLSVLDKQKFYDRSSLVMYGNFELSDAQTANANELLRRRQLGEPVAYLTNTREFYGRDFFVDERVLIPRPETEQIIDVAKEIYFELEKDKKVRICDVGTGSGCIGVTLKLELPKAEIIATDVSEDALVVAKLNAKKHNVKLDFIRADLLEGVPSADITIANLPYVDRKWTFLSKELDFEPELALFEEEGGLRLIKKLLNEIKKSDRRCYVILESDTCQQDEIISYAQNLGMELYKRLNFITVLLLR